VSRAVALGESHYDQKRGNVLVDVMLLPTGETYTAVVSSLYAGDGFGFYARIHKDDDLGVDIPSGDPRQGLIVSKRLWCKAGPPPTEIGTDEDEVMLIVEKDKNLRLKVSGSGKVVIDSPTIRLGDDNATEQVMLGTSFRTDQATMDTQLAIQLNAAGADPVLAAICPAAAAALVLAAVAIQTFENANAPAAQNYLSNVTNTK
jgi:hypothetical protein